VRVRSTVLHLQALLEEREFGGPTHEHNTAQHQARGARMVLSKGSKDG